MTNTHSWTWPDVKCALEKRGLSLTSLASGAGVSRQAFAKVKSCSSRRAQEAIAHAVGVPAEEIWPDRYRTSRRARRAA